MYFLLFGLLVVFCSAEERSPYIVKIQTDRWHISPTHDQVFLRLIGSNGVSRNISLDNPESEEFNVPNKVDTFRFDDVYIGNLKGVQITKFGFDRFLWSQIIVKTPKWTERLDELDSYNEGMVFDRTFFVRNYRGCPANTFWNREVCQRCPYNSCSFAGSLNAEDCSPSTCLILQLESKLLSLKAMLSDQKEFHNSKINEFTTNLETFERQLDSSVVSLTESLNTVSCKIDDSNAKVDHVSKELIDKVRHLSALQSRNVNSLKDAIGKVQTGIKETSTKLSQAKDGLAKNNNKLTSIRNDVDINTRKISETASSLNSRVDKLAQTSSAIQESSSNNRDISYQISTDMQLLSSQFEKKFEQISGTLAAFEEALNKLKNSLKLAEEEIESVRSNSTQRIETYTDIVGGQLVELHDATKRNGVTLSQIGRYEYQAALEDGFYPSGIQFHYPDNKLILDDKLEIKGIFPQDFSGNLNISLVQTNQDLPLVIAFSKNELEGKIIVYFEAHVNGVMEKLQFMDLPDSVAHGKPLSIQVFAEKHSFYVSLNMDGVSFPYVKALSDLDVKLLRLSGDTFCSGVTVTRVRMVSRSGGELEVIIA